MANNKASLVEFLHVTADTLKTAAQSADDFLELAWFQVGVAAANLKGLAIDIETGGAEDGE